MTILIEEGKFTEEQYNAIHTLHEAMELFVTSVHKCKDSDLPLVDAFAAIGVEVPRMVQPAINAMMSKLPSKSESKEIVNPEE